MTSGFARQARGAWLVVVLCVCVPFARAAAPTFQQLMDPTSFPDPQRGLRVEAATLDAGKLTVRTTGAELTLDLGSGNGLFRQRIGHQRDILHIAIADTADPAPELTHRGPGLAFARTSAFNLRANGDSLFMLHAKRPLRLTLKRLIDPGFTASWKANHVLFDEWGGFGLYCSAQEIDDAFDAYGDVTARYELPAGAVLWIGICPPKPYDWERSLRDNVIWHWSNTQGYPPDNALETWTKLGNTVLLQSEVMLWKDWNLAFEPRLGPAEFARVRDTSHRLGMKFIVYTSPFYFLRGTAREAAAMNSFKNFTNWPAGTPTGENIELFLAEIAKLFKQHKPDGLYFDGQYTENPAALYMLARRTRALLGEDGILEWHSTDALGPEQCFLPQADAYVDFILRGEGREAQYGDDRYLRYFVSCWNTSNSIGVICNNSSRPTPEFLSRLLAVNGRMHTMAGWLADAALMRLVNEDYKARLTPALRDQIEKAADKRQRILPEQARQLAAEQQALRSPPDWGKPIIDERFAAVPSWTQTVSPLNPAPFAITDGKLAITGKASTYAYLTRPLGQRISGMVFAVRRGTDSGASWGPAACIRFQRGPLIRVGLRNDNLLQGDILGNHRLAAGFEPAKTVWFRLRLTDHYGLVERSDDGENWRRLWTFEHGGAALDAQDISVGKVPYHGRPEDFTDPGPAGTCFIERLTLYEGVIPVDGACRTRLRCHHCQQSLDIVEDSNLHNSTCSSCGTVQQSLSFPRTWLSSR